MMFDIKIDVTSKTIDDVRGRPITLLKSRTFILCILSSVGNTFENNFYSEESGGNFGFSLRNRN